MSERPLYIYIGKVLASSSRLRVKKKGAPFRGLTLMITFGSSWRVVSRGFKITSRRYFSSLTMVCYEEEWGSITSSHYTYIFYMVIIVNGLLEPMSTFAYTWLLYLIVFRQLWGFCTCKGQISKDSGLGPHETYGFLDSTRLCWKDKVIP